jgi:uncharacterized protein YcbK (DUF882 family)/LysM repeat protein
MPTSARASYRTACSALFAFVVTATPVYAGAAEIVHIVGKGQTLGRIAKRYRVSVEALRDANGLRAGERIHPGLSLVIPGRSKDAAPAKKSPQNAAVAKRGRADKGQERGDRVRPGTKKKDAADPAEPTFRGPRRRGFVRMVRGTEKLEVQMLTRHGRLAPAALAGLTQMLRFYPSGAKLAVDPRLAALVGQVSEHFGGRTIHVVSGFRPYTPAQYTLHSNHNLGRAMDFSVEGVPNTVLRDYCRTFRAAGVGYYPNSTFVHLDVRAGKAYWVDFARPGEAPRYDPQNAPRNAEEGEPHAGAGDTPEAPPDPEDGSR